MLVLSRKPLEAVVVGEIGGIERMVKVTVLEIHHGSVRLGFEAADEVPIHRSEIWERIQSGGLKGGPPRGLEATVVW
jgi:carbon storage regulator CsrA